MKATITDSTSNEKKQSWQCKTSDVVYENPWIRVRHETVITPGGSDGIYGVVHFKNHAVGILPISDDGNTCLVQQSRYPHDCMTWEIPEGGAPLAEGLLDAAKRELQEETGLSAARWQLWMELQLSNSVTDEKATIFLAQGLTQGKMELDDTEDITIRHLSLRDAIQMVYNGEIVDAMTVAALLRAATSDEFKHFL